MSGEIDPHGEAERLAREAYQHYIEGADMDERRVNVVVATMVREQLRGELDVHGLDITTTQHDEAVILTSDHDRGVDKLGSFLVELNKAALDNERLEEDEFVDAVASRIRSMARGVAEKVRRRLERRPNHVVPVA